MNGRNALALLLVLSAWLAAQTTTVKGSPKVATTDPVSGTLTIVPVVSATSGSDRVLAIPVAVGFTRGSISVAVLPTDTMTPPLAQGSYKYKVTYDVPQQIINGHTISHNTLQCYWTVPTSGAPVDVGQIESCNTSAVPPLTSVSPAQIQQSGAADGQSLCWSQSAGKYTPGFCLGGYSLLLTQPSVSDTGVVQKVDDKYPYNISAVSCSTDRGTVQINLDIRANPNIPGPGVLASPLTCSSSTTTVSFVSPSVSVPAGYAAALDITDVTGSPGVVRVNVSR